MKLYYQKCLCKDPNCNQYTLSNQGSVGFSLEDARLFTASPRLLLALKALVNVADLVAWQHNIGTMDDEIKFAIEVIKEAEGLE